MTTVAGPAAVTCDPCVDGDWRQLSIARGHLFHSAPWLRVLRDAYGHRPRALLSPGGGIAWVDVDDLRGSRIRCLPFSDFGGPVPGSDMAALVDPLGRIWNADEPVAMRIVTGHPDQAVDRAAIARFASSLGLDKRPSHAWHWTDLQGPAGVEGRPSTEQTGEETLDDDPLWIRLSPKARQNIRRARRSGVHVNIDHSRASLAVFERLHRRLRRKKYRLLSQPTTFFDALHHHFGPRQLAVVTARVDGRAAAGVVLIRHGEWSYYKFNASNADGWASRANDLVMWSALTQARRWGCRGFDHGLSDLDQPGLIRYKDKFATGRSEVLTLTRAGRPLTRRASSIDRGLTTATRLATAERCPTWVAARTSAALYRLFC